MDENEGRERLAVEARATAYALSLYLNGMVSHL